VDDPPLSMVPGLAVKEAVGAVGAGGGGGGGGATFLWQAPRNTIALSANTRTAHRMVNGFVVIFIFLSCALRASGRAILFRSGLKSVFS